MAILRGVLDTNVVVAGRRARGASSPNREILSRWKSGEFTLLYSDDMVLEYVEKLLALGDTDQEVEQFIRLLNWRGERVAIDSFHLKRYPSDVDDIAFVLCAVNGNATHLVTYDAGFSEVAADCKFTVCRPLEFLAVLRSARTP